MFRPSAFPLAQTDSGLFIWLIVLVVLLLGAGVGVVWVRRRLSPHEDFHGEGFTLGDLRRLHKEGKLSDDEFERAKSGLIAMAQAAQQNSAPAGKDPPAAGGPSTGHP